MAVPRLIAATAVALVLSVAAAAPAPAATPKAPGPAESAAAARGALWLVGQFGHDQYVSFQGSPSLSATADAVLPLAETGVGLGQAAEGLSYLGSHLSAYLTADGADAPGQLATLILDVVATGGDPHDFGPSGTDLVSALLATQQLSGVDAGMFGSEAQVTGYSAGAYQQGLALMALAAAGVPAWIRPVASAVSWLDAQQCTGGGFTSDVAQNPCSGTPATYTGPDTNTTALAVEGLAAVGGLTSGVSSSVTTYLVSGQDADGGWSYYPSAPGSPQTSDPSSTGEVLQALAALGIDPATLATAGGTPMSAELSFQVTSGAGAEGFSFAPGDTPDYLSTSQAVLGLEGTPDPLRALVDLHGTGYWLVASDGGIFAFGDAGFHGSMGGSHLNAPIVGMAATPSGAGYWMVASDGGIFAFGDAAFHGSMGGSHLNAPIVGMAATPSGAGYWMVASDGGIFAFGDAAFHGAPVGSGSPVTALAPAADGAGYWTLSADGALSAFGAPALDPALTLPAGEPAVAAFATADGSGLTVVTAGGGVVGLGDAWLHGSLGALAPGSRVVGAVPVFRVST